jgi:hypothetical protein
MANWRDTILKNFKPKISRLTLVADPDGLLTEEGMLSAIKDRGFDLIPFDDPIAFRYAYESQYRSKWDKGKNTDLVVVLRSAEQQLNKLPYDLLKAGRPLTFALHQLFPKLNYPVIAGLDRSYLDAVDEGYQKHDGEQLTERGTKEFVLKKCFGIVPDLLTTPVELLKVLLSLHYRKVQLPEFLADYLLENLAKNATFESWPLAEIISSRESFFRFLQDEWKTFLAAQADPSVSCRIASKRISSTSTTPSSSFRRSTSSRAATPTLASRRPRSPMTAGGSAATAIRKSCSSPTPISK